MNILKFLRTLGLSLSLSLSLSACMETLPVRDIPIISDQDRSLRLIKVKRMIEQQEPENKVVEYLEQFRSDYEGFPEYIAAAKEVGAYQEQLSTEKATIEAARIAKANQEALEKGKQAKNKVVELKEKFRSVNGNLIAMSVLLAEANESINIFSDTESRTEIENVMREIQAAHASLSALYDRNQEQLAQETARAKRDKELAAIEEVKKKRGYSKNESRTSANTEILLKACLSIRNETEKSACIVEVSKATTLLNTKNQNEPLTALPISKLKDVEEAFLRIESAVSVGVNVLDYSNMIQQAALAVSKLKDELQVEDAKRAFSLYNEALETHTDARKFWRTWISFYAESGNETSYFGGLPLRLVGLEHLPSTYGLETTKSDIFGVYKGLPKASTLETLWSIAKSKREEADKLAQRELE